MTANSPPKPEPHPGVAATAIALMALMVAAAMQMFGLIESINSALTTWVAGFGLEGGVRELASGWVWCWTAMLTFGLCQAVLHVVGHWRRWLLLGLATGVTVAWIPVLALAGMGTPLGVPLAALLWGGGGAMVYAVRHREPEAG